MAARGRPPFPPGAVMGVQEVETPAWRNGLDETELERGWARVEEAREQTRAPAPIEPPPALPPPAEAPPRLQSLDAFRGLTILGMLLVNNMALDTATPPQFNHAGW